MSARSGGAEDIEAIQAFPFNPLFPSLLFTFLLNRFWPSTNGVGMGLPMEVEFPHAPEPPKGHDELYQSVLGLMDWYGCVCRMIVSFFVYLSFSSLILAVAAQEVCA